jgi:DNA-binding HxlR family transcriptional regulator
MGYQQFCPLSKAMEVIGDKWSLLIVREIMMGGHRFNVMQRGLSSISPTVLTKRLNELTEQGIVFKKRIPGQKGYEYFLTQSGEELWPVLDQLATWGMRWARGGMPDSDLDIELLMLYLERGIEAQKLPGNETVIRFHFPDVEEKYRSWWLVVTKRGVDTCIEDPGKDVDIYVTTDLRTMIEIWMGDTTYRQAIRAGRMKLIGPPLLVNSVSTWLAPASLADIRSAREITGDKVTSMAS